MDKKMVEKKIWYCTECGKKHTFGKYCLRCGTIRYSYRYLIHMERQSVCMGDDCNAPNAQDISYRYNETLSSFMLKVMDYVPAMKNVRWILYCGTLYLGYLFSDESGKYQYHIEEDILLSSLPKKEIFCKYEY